MNFKIRYDNDVRNFTHNLYNALIIIYVAIMLYKRMHSEINFQDYMAKLSCENDWSCLNLWFYNKKFE